MLAFSPSLEANSWTWIEDFESLGQWELASYSGMRDNVWWVEDNHLHGRIEPRGFGVPDFYSRILLFKGIPAKFTEFTISCTIVSREQLGPELPMSGLLVGGVQSCRHDGEELLEKLSERVQGFSCDLLEPEERPVMFYLFDIFFIEFRAFYYFGFNNIGYRGSLVEPLTKIPETKQMEINFKSGRFQLFSNQKLVYDFTDPDFQFVNQIGFYIEWERTHIEIANLRMSGRKAESVAVAHQGHLATTWSAIRQMVILK